MKLILSEDDRKYNEGDTFTTEQKRTGKRYWEYHKGVKDEEIDYDPNEGVPEEAKVYAYKQFLVKYNPEDPSTYQYAYPSPNNPDKLIPYLYPLYINADYGYKLGKWYKAGHGDYAQRINEDGSEYKDNRGKGYRMTMEKNLAFRPGDHAGSEPSMRHRGRADLPHHGTGEKADYDYFHSQEIFALVELSGQRDYTEDAKKRQIGKNVKTACFDDTSAFENGYYRFKTNNAASDKEAWYIAYAMKIIKVISDDEMEKILAESGTGIQPQKRGNPNGKDRNKFSADASLFQRRNDMNITDDWKGSLIKSSYNEDGDYIDESEIDKDSPIRLGNDSFENEEYTSQDEIDRRLEDDSEPEWHKYLKQSKDDCEECTENWEEYQESMKAPVDESIETYVHSSVEEPESLGDYVRGNVEDDVKHLKGEDRVIEHFPQYAIPYAMYGDTDGLDDNDISLIDICLQDNGITSITGIVEGTENEFDNNPEFGLPTSTVTVTF